jgi:hypothetical protein
MCKPNQTAAKTVPAVTSDNRKNTKTQPTKKLVSDQSDRSEELSKLQTSLLTLEERIIAMDEETSLQKELTNSELLSQKNCLDLILGEDKQRRASTTSTSKTNPLHIKVTSLEEKLLRFSETIQAQSINITQLLQAQQKKECALKSELDQLHKSVRQLHTIQSAEVCRLTSMENMIRIIDEKHQHYQPVAHKLSYDASTQTPSVCEQATQTSEQARESLEQTSVVTVAAPKQPIMVLPTPSTSLESTQTLASHDKKNRVTKYHTPAEINETPQTRDIESSKDRDIANNRRSTSGQSRSSVVRHETGLKNLAVNNEERPRRSTNLEANSQTGHAVQDREQNRSTGSGRATYRVKKCLFINDGSFGDFDKDKFTNEFDVHSHKTNSFRTLMRDSEKWKSLLTKAKPECVFIHLGKNDGKRRIKDTMADVEELLWYLLENSYARVCFSTIIPTNSDSINTSIEELNHKITELVTMARRNPANKSCLFTYCNKSVTRHNRNLPEGVKLTEAGQNIMWKRLNDGFRKTLQIYRPQINTGTSSNHRNNNNDE